MKRVSFELGGNGPFIVFDDADLDSAVESEVIERANQTQYGLASYLFTRDMGRILRFNESLEFGLVGINDVGGYTHEVPFGGFKESGIGREGGRRGIEEYMEEKTIVVNLNSWGN